MKLKSKKSLFSLTITKETKASSRLNGNKPLQAHNHYFIKSPFTERETNKT